MRKIIFSTVLFGSLLGFSIVRNQTTSEVTTAPRPTLFTFTPPSGGLESVPLVDDSAKRKLSDPSGDIAGIDPSLTRAATIADERANAHSKSLCWHYVKDALVASGAVSSRPETQFAKQAGDELVHRYGFRKLDIRDPYAAPVGAVLVYDAKDAPGHVEIRTTAGFASDFRTKVPSRRPLIGVFVKA